MMSYSEQTAATLAMRADEAFRRYLGDANNGGDRHPDTLAAYAEYSRALAAYTAAVTAMGVQS